jgi:SpoVK/Ycf46/Vps4 family AAA+-type ATPase
MDLLRMELIGGGGGGAGETGGVKDGGAALSADVAPVVLDQSIRFANVGGLEKHVTCLKEMVVFPMLYPEVFAKFSVTPPKGVLFHGPPGKTTLSYFTTCVNNNFPSLIHLFLFFILSLGTGKTLVARALANECSLGARKVSFFMRKGADCLSKWVGESERQLRLLFEEVRILTILIFIRYNYNN